MNWEYIEHFTRDEFGQADGVEPDWDMVMRLGQAREIAGIPFVITSGLRSDEHNARVVRMCPTLMLRSMCHSPFITKPFHFLVVGDQLFSNSWYMINDCISFCHCPFYLAHPNTLTDYLYRWLACACAHAGHQYQHQQCLGQSHLLVPLSFLS